MIRGAIIAALAYTVLTAFDSRYAMMRWLIGLGCVALGTGLIASSRHLKAEDLNRRLRLRKADLHDPLEIVFALLPASAVPDFQAVAGSLLTAAGGLLAASSALAL